MLLYELQKNLNLSLLFLRLPRHRVTCDLIPLAVLKRAGKILVLEQRCRRM